MMKALREGGMPVLWNEKIEERTKRIEKAEQERTGDDYEINPEFLEIGPLNTGEPGFPLPENDGCALKFVIKPPGSWSLPIRHCEHQIIVMRRDIRENVDSWERAFPGRPLSVTWQGAMIAWDKLEDDALQAWYDAWIPNAINAYAQRKDCKRLIQVDYSDLCKTPVGVFKGLKDFLDLPIDVEAAAAVIDPSLRRVVA
jgi:hypothetical protein